MKIKVNVKNKFTLPEIKKKVEYETRVKMCDDILSQTLDLPELFEW